MKLIDWYNFNFGNEQFNCNIGDIYVKVFRRQSYEKGEMIIEQLMKPSDMAYLFGDYEMFCFSKDTHDSYCTMSVFIYKAD